MKLTSNPSLSEVAALLSACGLPSDDIEPGFLSDFVLAKEGSTPVGVAGLQLLDSCALVRSVGVLRERRSQGAGAELVAAIEDRARALGVTRLYLLTNDAQGFFSRLGYRALERCAAPPEVQRTAQFGSSCCGGATLMQKTLDQADDPGSR